MDIERLTRKTADTVRVIPFVKKAEGPVIGIGKLLCPSLVVHERMRKDEKEQLASLVEIATSAPQFSPDVSDCATGLVNISGEEILEHVDEVARADRTEK